ncbi:MAG: DUF4397 domain-containing protein [Burkholderiaceae bacterium]|nr:DUF4397 domain-containing protein [Rhodoferax sp.]MCP5284463.1 DUF4397 domain-containing protein [Burkholderiaceae bacterium]
MRLSPFLTSRGLRATARLVLALSLAAPLALSLSACGGGGDDAGQAQIRLLNLSTSKSGFDLVAVDSDDDETVLAESVPADTVTSRSGTTAGELSYQLRRAGNDTAAVTTSWSLSADTAYTAIAYGSDSALKLAMLEEDEDTPVAGKARLRVYNTSGSGALDVYLTNGATSLDEASITTTVSSNASSGFVTVSAGTYRLRLTGSGDVDDLRLDTPVLTLDSTSVVTLVLTAGEGGVLVHAATLVQDGGLALFKNTSARVRVAAGVAGNAAIDAGVGGIAVASAQRGPSVGAYRLVTAGSNQVLTMAVNGEVLAENSLTLKAGGDYTFAVTGTSAADAAAALVADDNSLPASGYARVRLFNVMATLTGGLSLDVDYATLAEDVAVGAASSFTTLSAATDVPLTVSTPLSTTALLTIDEADFTSTHVYTVFQFGTVDSPYGFLKKER